jgi:hypothetical protein
MAWTSVVLAQDTLTVDRLDYRFVFQSEGILLPLTSLEEANVAGLFITCPDDQLVEICSNWPITIWIDGRNVKSNQEERCVYLTSEELCSFSERERPYLSVVSEMGFETITARTIVLTDSVSPKQLSVRKENSAYWIFGFLFGCMLLASVKLARLTANWRVQRPKLKEFTNRFLTLENVFLMVLVAVINSLCYWFLVNKSESIFVLQLATLILLVWFMKTLLVYLSGSIFKYWKWANWQLIFQLRFWVIVSILLFIILLGDFVFFSKSKLYTEMILNMWAICSLVFLLLTSVVLLSQKGLKNLHIFIYLCTTEILPIMLLVHLFLE